MCSNYNSPTDMWKSSIAGVATAKVMDYFKGPKGGAETTTPPSPTSPSPSPTPSVTEGAVNDRRSYLSKMRQGILSNIKTGASGITGSGSNLQGQSTGKTKLGQ